MSAGRATISVDRGSSPLPIPVFDGGSPGGEAAELGDEQNRAVAVECGARGQALKPDTVVRSVDRAPRTSDSAHPVADITFVEQNQPTPGRMEFT
ncbi:hypothetical protein GCM10023175_54410 [Pseudonocardia xishanensis]|uniref:Uncharacterized protein n=1 Tax=Pseudonocardia xishanensis TaxID=630995 RepID=A0ABP8RZW3_9PSEU